MPAAVGRSAEVEVVGRTVVLSLSLSVPGLMSAGSSSDTDNAAAAVVSAHRLHCSSVTTHNIQLVLSFLYINRDVKTKLFKLFSSICPRPRCQPYGSCPGPDRN